MQRTHHLTPLCGLIFVWKMKWTGGLTDSRIENLLGIEGLSNFFSMKGKKKVRQK